MKTRILMTLFLLSTVTLFAASVTVTQTTLQAKNGLLQNVYYETASGPGSTTPGTNTALVPSGSSGSYSVPASNIAYLWSPSFSSATSIPAGKLAFDIYAVANPVTFGLDGSASAASAAAVIALALTTANANDVLYLSVTGNTGATVSSITSIPSLTWAQRSITTFSSTYHLETWYAVWPSSGAISITVTLAGGSGVGVVFGIKGANTGAPFDSGAGIPATNAGVGGTSSSATISTSNSNDFLIGALGVHGSPTPTAGTGFTNILSISSGVARHVSDEYQVVTTTQSNLVVGYTWSGAHDWAMVADAVVAASQPMTINVRTTTSSGTLSSTLVASTSTTSILSTKSGTSTVLSITAGSVPAGGYIEVILTAPSAASITIYWGTGQATNFELATVLLT